MLITLTPTLKKAYTLLPSLKVLKGKKRKAIRDFSNKDIVNTLEN
jgi:hypothetical protein